MDGCHLWACAASFCCRGAAGLVCAEASDEVGLQPACPPYSSTDQQNESRKNMNIFSIIGVVVVVLVLLGYFGFR
jgi:hypothetical protein